jgi:hypothetical protein
MQHCRWLTESLLRRTVIGQERPFDVAAEFADNRPETATS